MPCSFQKCDNRRSYVKIIHNFSQYTFKKQIKMKKWFIFIWSIVVLFDTVANSKNCDEHLTLGNPISVRNNTRYIDVVSLPLFEHS